MGLYATTNDVIAEYPRDLLQRLTDDERAGVISNDRIERAIAWAEAYINAKLYAFYRVPFTERVPELVRRWTIDLAVWRLFQRWSDDARVRERREAVDRDLERVASGEMRIPDADSAYKGDVGYILRRPVPWPRRGGQPS